MKLSKTVKVEDQVYDQLDRLRGKGETFSQVIEALLLARSGLFTLFGQLEVDLKYREYQQQQLRELVAAREED